MVKKKKKISIFGQTKEETMDKQSPTVQETVQETTEVKFNERKERLKRLRAGEEQMTPDDFTIGEKFYEEEYNKYRSIIDREREQAKEYFDLPEHIETAVKSKLQWLHGKSSPFAKFLPYSPNYRKPKPVNPDVDRLNQLTNAITRKFHEWYRELPEAVELENFIREKVPSGATIKVKSKDGTEEEIAVELPTFNPYWRGSSIVKKYLTENNGTETETETETES